MPDLKLVRIENGDSQKVFIDKINQNFNNILGFGGGPYGKVGPQDLRVQRGSQVQSVLLETLESEAPFGMLVQHSLLLLDLYLGTIG